MSFVLVLLLRVLVGFPLSQGLVSTPLKALCPLNIYILFQLFPQVSRSKCRVYHL